MCNLPETQWHILVGSRVCFFCDPKPAGLFRQMMERCSQWYTPGPTSHSPHVLHPAWQHAWAWHFGQSIHRENSNPYPPPAPRICHRAGWLKIIPRHDGWIELMNLVTHHQKIILVQKQEDTACILYSMLSIMYNIIHTVPWIHLITATSPAKIDDIRIMPANPSEILN